MPGYVYRGKRPLPPKPDDWEETPAEEVVEAECGTYDGYNQHRRRKEKICDDCKEARNAQRRLSPEEKKRKQPPCGTARGYVWHRRHGEEVDLACRTANAQDAIDRRGTPPERQRPRFKR